MQHHESAATSSENAGCNQQEFAAGTRVQLQNITSRPALNGKEAVIEAWDAASKRYLVRLEDGDQLRVRPRCIHRRVDATLFVQAESFVQPGAPAAPEVTETCAMEAEAMEHRLRLPAGHWEVRLVEHDGLRLTVTLVATVKRAAPEEDAEQPEHSAAWNELRGFTCTRSLFVGTDVLTADVSVAAEAGVLCVRVPHAQAERPEEGATGVAVQEEEESPAEMEIDTPLKDKLRSGHTVARPFSMDVIDKENYSEQPGRADPHAMERWSDEELQRASEAMPPVCVVAA